MNMAAKPYTKKKKTQKFFAMTQKAKDAFALSLDFMKKDYEISIFEKRLDDQIPGWKSSSYLINKKQGYEGHIYTGYNIPMLYWHKDDIFITLKHIEKLGAQLKPDAQMAFISGWFPFTKKTTETDQEFHKRTQWNKGCHTSYIVYGISQVKGLPEKKTKTDVPFFKKESVEEFISRFALLQNITIESIGSTVSFDLLKIPLLSLHSLSLPILIPTTSLSLNSSSYSLVSG